MDLKSILKRFPLLKNKFFLAGVVFVLWLGFVDENNLIERLRLESEYKQLQQDKEYYNEKIQVDSYHMEELDESEKLEKIAREKYLMKKEDEEIFVIKRD